MCKLTAVVLAILAGVAGCPNPPQPQMRPDPVRVERARAARLPPPVLESGLRVEAESTLKKIFDGAKVYFESGTKVKRDSTVIVVQFPASVALTPEEPCCGPGRTRCPAAARTAWAHAVWKSMGVENSDPHAFQYGFWSEGEKVNARFIARAVRQMACRGRYKVFELRGKVDFQFRVIRDGTMREYDVVSPGSIKPRAEDVDRDLNECRAWGHPIQRDGNGHPIYRPGRHGRPEYDKAKPRGHCKAVWHAQCQDAAFRKIWPGNCKKAKPLPRPAP